MMVDRQRFFLAFVLILATPVATRAQEKEMEFETTELRSAEEYQTINTAAEKLLKQDLAHQAILKLIGVLDTGEDNQSYYHESEYLMGAALFQLKLYQSSYMYFERVLMAEKKHHRFRDVLPWLVAIHRRIPGETDTLEQMATYETAAYPPNLKNEIHFNVGQFHYNQDALKKALKALKQVTAKDEIFYFRARYLEGVTHVRNNSAVPASESFKDILRYKGKNGISTKVGAKIHRMAMLSLARIFYTIGKYKTAVRYYDRITEYTTDWLDSLLEVSWGYFQVDNFGRALGNLHTLNSPYFEEEYFPEALVLESVILYTHCHYDEALESVNRFIKSYLPLYKELQKQLQVPRDPNQFYAWLARMSQQGADLSLRLKRIINAALTDRKLNRAFRFVLHLNKELTSLKRLSQNASMTQFAASIEAEVSSARELVIGNVGRMARRRLRTIHKELKNQLANALKVKFETLSSQKRAIERNQKNQVSDDDKARKPIKVDSEHQYWPFEGEYWKDELDSYFVGIKSRCPKSRKK